MKLAIATRLGLAAVLPLAVLPLVGALGPAAARAATPTPADVFLHVQSARDVNPASGFVHKGDAVTKYQWLIAAERTADQPQLGVGNPNDALGNCLPQRASSAAGSFTNSDPNWADTCQWPSIRYTPGNVAVVSQGNQDDLSDTKALANLAPGRYLVSVTANGYKIDGAHFTVDGNAGPSRVTVEMQPYPLPLATVRLRVFSDTAPVDGTYELGAERGLAGFRAQLSDVLGQVTTDYYGNPLCTVYHLWGDRGFPVDPAMGQVRGQVVFDDAGKPVVNAGARNNGRCISDANGDITIRNLGPNRYAAQVLKPAGSSWMQTTTLEGGHDWDVWAQEGDTGYDTEQTIGGERVPYVDFGFTPAKSLPAGPTGAVKGVIMHEKSYIASQGGQRIAGYGVAGGVYDGPVANPLIALSDLTHNDQLAYMGPGNADGSFRINNVPDGSYQLTAWDADQNVILDSFNVLVAGGKVTDVGVHGLVDWFTDITGTVFQDNNGNGKQDPGEPGVPRFPVVLKERDNTLMDQGLNAVATDDQGRYRLRQSYPLSKFLVLEAFNTRYQTTGVTVQADNEKVGRTMLGSAVDISVLPIIGLGGKVDWGVQPYQAGTNGGIVGTITYDTTRNELDPADAATETYQPGVPGIPVKLYAPVPCASGDTPGSNTCSEAGWALNYNPTDPKDPSNGSMVKGPQLQDTYTSETWQQPRNCIARQYNGTPFSDTAQLSLPDGNATGNGQLCLEAPLMGFQAQPSDATPGAFGQTVNGNYGFTTSKLNLYRPTDARDPKDANGNPLPQYAVLADYGLPEQSLLPADYIVGVDIPKDNYGKPLYTVTREEDVNVFNGDGYLPQENFPPTAANAADQPNPPDPSPTAVQPPSQQAGIVSACVGDGHTVATNPETNPGFAAAGGSPFEGQWRQLCTDKLVTVRDGQAVAPNFNLFTPVPLPTHFWGLVINDLGLSHDPRQAAYGEAQPIPNVPTGIYDWSGRLVDTVTSDFNGMYEALEPSTSTYNCPLPAGPCPNMYRFVGNDPGQPGAVNANYNPRFRTIATNFQAWPGLYTVTDTAPTQVAVTALSPDTTQSTPVNCDLAATTPQLFAVSQPYVRNSAATELTLTGVGFGAEQGTGTVTLGGTSLAVNSWTDRSISVTVPQNAAVGPQRLLITAGNGQTSVAGLTVQVLGTGYQPTLLEVGPGKQFATVQAALQRAANSARALVVVWPNAPAADNPRQAYFENVVLHSSVKLQGVGPGGTYPDGTYVPGSVLNGLGFNPDNQSGTDWVTLVGSTPHAGPTLVPNAAVVTVLGNAAMVRNAFKPAIDGFTITGGAQADFPNNVNAAAGVVKTPYGAPGAAVTQGGGVYVHAAGRGLQISDNVIVGNSGSYGGAIRVGTPYTPSNLVNDGIVIANNRIRDNGGTNLAGAVALFENSDNYRVQGNDLCGNFSAEYGGAISHFGYSTGGQITGNRIYFNQSYDEGGGVLIGGDLTAKPTTLSRGSGNVTVDANLIQDNIANDDGGGLRLLMVETGRVRITNNFIVNNISAHEGGGVAIDDAPYVDFVNNTVMKNITTATAITSDGTPAPAGLSTAQNSDALQAWLNRNDRTGAKDYPFSKPTLLNDIFADNRAGAFTGGFVSGIGSPQDPGGTDPATYNYWDLGVADGTGVLSPTHSLFQQTAYAVDNPASAGNRVGLDPQVKTEFPTSVVIQNSRTTPFFRESVVVADNVPPTLMGDYHLSSANSPAIGAGAADTGTPPALIQAPATDYDGQSRPSGTRWDAGADQLP